MKKIIAIFALLATVAACSKENEKGKDGSGIAGVFRQSLTVNMPEITADSHQADSDETAPETRTAFGTPSVSTIPLVWSAGDRIAVVQDRGLVSQKISIYELEGPGGSPTGTFTYVSGDASDDPSEIKDVIYPASAASDYAIPTGQAYVAGGFDPAAALLTWHSDTGAGASGITLSAASAIVCLQLTGSSALKVSSIKVTINSTDYTLACASPVEMSSTAVPFYICVPSCSDENVEFLITFDNGKTVKKVSLSKTFNLGDVRTFPECEAIAVQDLFEEGMVFLTDYTNGWIKILSLDEEVLAFSIREEYVGTEANPDEGYSNTAMLASSANYSQDNYPAVWWCVNYKDGSWYIPSRRENIKIFQNLLSDAVRERSQALLVYYGSSGIAINTNYLSACETGASDVKRCFKQKVVLPYELKGSNLLKSSPTNVRAIKKIIL